MPKFPTFFRADEEITPSKTSPSPNEWFGTDKTKWRTDGPSLPTVSEENDDSYDGWREFYQGHPRDPMDNELQVGDSQNESLRFKNSSADPRSLIYFLEQAAEIFEAKGHIDLAAECERLCEMYAEDVNA